MSFTRSVFLLLLASNAIAAPIYQYVTAPPVVEVITIYQDGYSTSSATSIPFQTTSTAIETGSTIDPSSTPVPSSSSSAGISGDLGGISYSPYHSDQSCKSESEVAQDIQAMISAGYSTFRLYGVDCNQVANCLAAIKGSNAKIFAGIYDVNSVASEVQQLISQVGGDWSSISTVSILNEAVNDGTCSVAQAVSLTQQSKSTLVAAGYSGPVINVDTFNQIIANPELCSAGDFVGANCHPYFAGVSSSQAGQYVQSQLQAVQSACGGKQVLITETGWPTAGDTDGSAVPSVQDQQAALASIKSSLSSDYILFCAFNDLWKSPGAQNVEQHWGVMTSPSP